MSKLFYKAQSRINLIKSLYGADVTQEERISLQSIHTIPIFKNIRMFQRASRLAREGRLGYIQIDPSIFPQVFLYERVPGTKDFIHFGVCSSGIMDRVQKYPERCVNLKNHGPIGEYNVYQSMLGYTDPEERKAEIDMYEESQERLKKYEKFFDELEATKPVTNLLLAESEDKGETECNS